MILFFFFNDTATTEIYTLSLHDALPISIITTYCRRTIPAASTRARTVRGYLGMCRTMFQQATSSRAFSSHTIGPRSEEHTSELQSQSNLVCRLLLEKKKKLHCYRLPDVH